MSDSSNFELVDGELVERYVGTLLDWSEEARVWKALHAKMQGTYI